MANPDSPNAGAAGAEPPSDTAAGAAGVGVEARSAWIEEVPARLKEEIDRLSKQVRQLVKTESELYRKNEAFDSQVNIYRRLSDIGRHLNAARAPEAIAELVVRFCVYELGFERCVLFARSASQPAGLQAMAIEGYFDRAHVASVRAIVLDIADVRLTPTLSEGRPVVVAMASAEQGLAQLGRSVGMDEFFLWPVGGEPGRAFGLLLAGNSQKKARYQSRVEANSIVGVGMANLVNETSFAINNALSRAELEAERALLERKVEERTEALNSAFERLKKADELKTQFFANVSHELRTPLTLSIGPLELLMREATLAPAAKRTLEVTLNNQHRLSRLINDLLDFAKLEAGRMTARFAPLRVTDAVLRYVETLEAAAQSRQISLEFKADDPTVELYLDAGKFEKIVMNLLSNAFKFTPERGRITVRMDCDDAWVRIVVADSGIGIPTEAVSMIFDRFSQVDASSTRRYSGTGIGLALVKEYAELHGGSVGVSSEVGKGSSFTVSFRRGRKHLPEGSVDADAPKTPTEVSPEILAEFRVEPSEQFAEATAPDDEAAPGPQVTVSTDDELEPNGPSIEELVKGAKVVVADDTTAMRNMVCRILSATYRVYPARDGLEALELSRKVAPDLIVSDLMMPRMSGTELCQAIRASPGPLARTPVILVTARADMESKLEGLRGGADDYLAKPFNADELVARCRNIIRLRRQEQRIGAISKQVLQRDLELAGAVQSLLLPRERFKDEHWDVAGVCRAAAQVSGDWWWHGRRADGALVALAGDVTGHGAGPAMVTATATGTCRTFFQLSRSLDVDRLLELLNANLLDACGGEFWLSLVALELSPHERAWRVWSAGAPPVLVSSGAGSARFVSAPGTLLGGPTYQLGRVEGELHPGDRFCLYTDGAYAFRTTSGREFGLKDLARLVEETRGRSAAEARDHVLEELTRVRKTERLEDDLTLVFIDALA
jgi:signal transduction histidine kinase/serine phosphatase RsbU (regulator of sigma subunit)